ncbi:MAG: hypothetical protein ACYC6O_00100 [Thermoleophilia bacterium]
MKKRSIDLRVKRRRLRSGELSRFFVLTLLAASAVSMIALTTGCNEEPTVKTTVETTPTSTTAPYQRQVIAFYKGITEPRADAWEEMPSDSERLHRDGFNIVTLSPPVLITQRAGGQPRVILEGAAGSVPGTTGDLHQAGLAVFISPTTAAAGFEPQLETSDAILKQLTEDSVRWAETAEQTQAELFSPLADYNLALGTETANKWSAEVLPLIRQKYRGEVVARVVPDINTTVKDAGAVRDYELLDFKGYDYLMLYIQPYGSTFDPARFDIDVDELIKRANAIAARDGLKGVLVEFGGWREEAGVDTVEGPILGEGGQAVLAERMIQSALPRTKGIFWRGWTLPGRGAKDHMVEASLRLGWQ